MTETLTSGAEADPDVMYGAEYYHSHCGDVPYAQDSPQWLAFYGKIADEIVRSFAPARVYDAGCAIGFLVAALWDRNVEAHGRDISAYAISQVRADVREYCDVGSIADPVTGTFDLVLCIEVLEHMPEQEAIAAIRTMCAAAPRVLFSSTPSDFDEPTHVNVRPTLYWLRQFAAANFAPAVSYDASYVCPHAMLLERGETAPREEDLIAFAEIVRQRIRFASEAERSTQLAAELADMRAAMLSERAARQASEELSTSLRDESELRTALAAPTPIRRYLERLLKVAWWTVTLQLPARLRARAELRLAQRTAPTTLVEAEPAEEPSISVTAVVTRRFAATEPLRTFATPDSERRVSMVTDSIGEGSLFGGVGTALIVGTLLAEHLHARLRLITRTERPNIERIRTVLDAQGLTWNGDIDIVHSPPTGSEDVPLGPGDVFLTTSWWTTCATLGAVPPYKVIYLLQEDERLFYGRGDEQLRCAETLGQADLHCLINSALLYRHFSQGPEPLAHLGDRALWFEPAFPRRLFYDDGHRSTPRTKRNLFFYARPNNLRNLYWRGLEAIGLAIEEGVLDPDNWIFTFVGKDLTPVELPGGVIPEMHENLNWQDYANVVRTADLGLALMDTPHASYPPLDLAASGAVVITSSCGIKVSLEEQCANIITVSPTVSDICAALGRGVGLAEDEPRRRENFEHSGIERDWRSTLAPAIRQCAEWLQR